MAASTSSISDSVKVRMIDARSSGDFSMNCFVLNTCTCGEGGGGGEREREREVRQTSTECRLEQGRGGHCTLLDLEAQCLI
jgi:hypothetical protein